MPSYCYDSFLDDVARGQIDVDGDTFYALITTNSYTPNQGTHTRRSDITNEVSGTGYTAGGQSVTVSVSKDTTNHQIVITLGGGTWTSSTITGRKIVYYKRRGGAASADELVAVNEQASDIVSSGGTWTLNSSTITIPTPAA